MHVFYLIVRKDVPRYIRILAFCNLFCFFYMLTMTITVTKLSFVYIVPYCYDDRWSIFKHRTAMAYLFLSVIGSFITCVRTDPGAEQKMKDDKDGKALRPKLPWRKAKLELDTNMQRKRKAMLANGKTDRTTLVKKDKNGDTANAVPRKVKQKWCDVCKREVPDRCHHCILCERCIYKRDHHCFFMGVCIGYNNQKYFIFFILFMGIGTFYGLMMIVQYMNLLYGITFYGPQTFVAIFYETIFSLFKGKGPSMKFIFLMILMNACLFATVFAFGFLYWQLHIVLRGQTTFECTRGIKTYSNSSKLTNFRECFGRWWIMSLLIPFIDLIRWFSMITGRSIINVF